MKNNDYYNTLLQHPSINDDLRNELKSSKKIRYEIEKVPGEEGNDLMSKLGGFPELPTHTDYPSNDNNIYEFVCQINFGEIENFDTEIKLPNKGLLSFFIYDDSYRTKVPNLVLYQNDLSDLEIKKPSDELNTLCESFDSRTETTTTKLKFIPSVSIDQTLMNIIHDEMEDELIFTSFGSKNQLLGNEINWRDPDYKWKAYLAQKGWEYIHPFVQHYKIKKYEDNDALAINEIKNQIILKISQLKESIKKYGEQNFMYKYWKENVASLEKNIDAVDLIISNYKAHKTESQNWIHLLGLYSDSKAQIHFGDGKMQFFIHKNDLKELNFSNVYCDICN